MRHTAETAPTYGAKNVAQFDKEPAQRGPFTSELRDRLGRLAEILGGAEGDLSALRSEKMGPYPIYDHANGTAGRPEADFEEILSGFDHMIERADAIAGHAQVLRNGI